MTTAIETVVLTSTTGNRLHLEPVDRVIKVVDDGEHRTVTIIPGRIYRIFNREIPSGQPFTVRVRESVQEVMSLTKVRPSISIGTLPRGQYTRYDGNLVVSNAIPWAEAIRLVKSTIADLRGAGNDVAADGLTEAAVVDLRVPKMGPLSNCPSYCVEHTPSGFDEDCEPSHKSAEWPSGVAIYGLGDTPPVIDLPIYDDCDVTDARQLAADLLAAAVVLENLAANR